MSHPLYQQGNNPWYPLKKRAGGSHGQSGCWNERHKSLLLLGIKPWSLVFQFRG